jgi:hypothetical protein
MSRVVIWRLPKPSQTEIWSWTPWDSEPRITVLTRPTSILALNGEWLDKELEGRVLVQKFGNWGNNKIYLNISNNLNGIRVRVSKMHVQERYCYNIRNVAVNLSLRREVTPLPWASVSACEITMAWHVFLDSLRVLRNQLMNQSLKNCSSLFVWNLSFAMSCRNNP